MFFELLKKHKINLSEKYAAQISTSKHFYDITACNYVKENCLDLGFKYLDCLTADMDDITTSLGQKQADAFFLKLMFKIQHKTYIQNINKDIKLEKKIYSPSLEIKDKDSSKEVVLVTNVSDDDVNLKNMILDFKNNCNYKVKEVNIRDFKFSGGCLGCLNCATKGKCIYKDGFEDLLRNEIQNCDAVVTAFTIENHFIHSSLKCYYDRQFCNGHRTVSNGKCCGYLISGDLSKESNLRMILEARTNVSKMFNCGIATDEIDPKKDIVALNDMLQFALENKLTEPQNFYGVGGTKIFRDLVYQMQGIMKEDHKFYKKNGIYDFPQNKKKIIFQSKLIGLLLSSKTVQKKIRGKMTEYIIAPYSKIIANTKPYEKD